MISTVIEARDTTTDKPVQILEATWTTPGLLPDGHHAVLQTLPAIIQRYPHLDLMTEYAHHLHFAL